MTKFAANASLITNICSYPASIIKKETIIPINPVMLYPLMKVLDLITFQISIGDNFTNRIIFCDLPCESAGGAITTAIGYFLLVIKQNKIQSGISPVTMHSNHSIGIYLVT